ncbi:lipocalin family protein [Propionivibrio sp.]|uniref:lipocalin family protein n=1 Tax=Propionivibrio sp. TaxID=2212460 RepID=UPI00272DE9A4|nr:lipocalin family protein [Propionivibrio sp.]
MRFLLAPFISCLVAFSAQAAGDPPRTPVPPLVAVPSLDVERYMGTWYEIAKYPNRFQRQCVADTRAEYSQMPDGRVRVINRCRLESGEFESADGVARLVGGTGSPKLEVRFAPAWLSFIPAVWGDYWVIDIDDAYRLVAVSEPKRDYLWVLSRTPTVDPARYAALLGRLGAMGFDLDRLETTPQGNGLAPVR